MVAYCLNRIILFLGLLLMILDGGSLSYKDYALDERSFTPESLKMVEENTGLTFPVGSRGLHMYYQETKCIDPSFVAKVEIPEASKDAVTKQIEQIENHEIEIENPLAKQVTWWKPSAATIRVERHFRTKSGHVHVLLCQEGERWVLYVEWNCV